jgi:glycosyltransferase 2 family protein
MSPRRKAVLLQIGALALGLGLLWLALRGVDFGEVVEALAAARLGYLIPLTAAVFASHLIRAWRWRLLLDVLPDGAEARRRVRLGDAFSAVMIGYMVNYAAPRVGEVARSANLAAQSDRPLSGILGTVVAERALDVASLVVALAVAFALGARRFMGATALLDPGRALAAAPDLPWWGLLLAALVVIAASVALVRLVRGRRAARNAADESRLTRAIHAFRDGLLSLARTRRTGALLVSTAAMWGCYLLMAYLPLPLLRIDTLGLADAWVLLVMGSLAVIVPAPGGVGPYHYITIQLMTRVFAVALAPATAYAVFTHAAQLFLYTATGFVCLLLQGRGLALRVAPPAEATPRAS